MSDCAEDYQTIARIAQEVWDGWPDIRFKLKPETCHRIRDEMIEEIVKRSTAAGVGWFRAQLEASGMIQNSDGGWELQLRILYLDKAEPAPPQQQESTARTGETLGPQRRQS